MSQKAADIQQDIKAGAERIRVVKEMLRTLTKAAKAFKLYSETHHLVARFLGETETAIAQALKVCGTIWLEVTDTAFLLGEEVVYEQKGQDGNYAFLLYKDGVRRLLFRSRPTQKELRSFIDVIGKTPAMLAQTQDDMVTLLWKAGLESIGYKAIDAFAEMMMGDPHFKEDYDSAISDILPGFAEVVSEQEDSWGAELRQSTAPQRRLDVGLLERIQGKLHELMRTRTAQQRLHDRLAAEESIDGLFRHMAAVLLRCSLTPSCPIPWKDRIRYFVNLLAAMLQAKAHGAYLTSTATMEILVRHPQLLQGEMPVVLKRVLREATTGDRLIDVLRILQQVEEKTLVAIGQFFLRNSRVPVQRLMELTDEELSWGGRVLVRAMMLSAGKDEFDTWMGWLAGKDEEKDAEAITCIAEQIELERSIPVLRRSLRHSMPMVRLEAGKHLVRIDIKSFGEAVLKLLEDPEPAVRKGMIPLLEKFDPAQLVEPLQQRVRSRDFRAGDDAERAAWIAVMARPGLNDFLPVFEQLMEFSAQKGLKGLFVKKALELNPLRQAVLDALFEIGTPEARRLVDLAVQEGDAAIRAYCHSFELEQRHKQLKRGMQEGEKKDEQRADTFTPSGSMIDVQLRLTPVPEPDPAAWRDLLIPLAELIPLAPERARYTSMEQVPDRLADEEDEEDRIGPLGRRAMLEKLRPGAAMQEAGLQVEHRPASAEPWSMEPQAVLLLLPPQGLLFAVLDENGAPAMTTPRPDPARAITASDAAAPTPSIPQRIPSQAVRSPTEDRRLSTAGGSATPTPLLPRQVPFEGDEKRRSHPEGQEGRSMTPSAAAAASQRIVTPLPRPITEETAPASSREGRAAPMRRAPSTPPPPERRSPTPGLGRASSPDPISRSTSEYGIQPVDEPARPPAPISPRAPLLAPSRSVTPTQLLIQPVSSMPPDRAAAIDGLLRKYLRDLEERQLMPAPAVSYKTPTQPTIAPRYRTNTERFSTRDLRSATSRSEPPASKEQR